MNLIKGYVTMHYSEEEQLKPNLKFLNAHKIPITTRQIYDGVSI